MNNPIKRLGGEGILNQHDVFQFTKVEKSLIEYMADQEWYSATCIIGWSGQREGLRRLRDLRQKSYVVERKRNASSRDFFYRLIPAPAPASLQTNLAL